MTLGTSVCLVPTARQSLALKQHSDPFCPSGKHLLLHFPLGSASQGTVSLFVSGLAHKAMIFPCSHPTGAVTPAALASEGGQGSSLRRGCVQQRCQQ